MMKIKFCGLFREVDIDYVNDTKPDYVGFVFAKSKRQVDLKQARLLKSKLAKDILVVGVFVDDSIDFIELLVQEKIIDLVQLHGHEDNAYIKELRYRMDVSIIKAQKITTKQDLDDLNYDVDYYLLDNAISGSGQCFDWSLIKQLAKPFFLAGGINLDNLDEAMKINCFALDVSSGIETNGVKDHDKMKKMVRRIRDGSR